MELTELKRVTANFVNLTPHALDVRDISGDKTSIPPSGEIARIEVRDHEVVIINNIMVYRALKGKVEGLPAPKDGVFYLVSLAVRDALPDRQDLLSPGNLLRRADGTPEGCNGLRIN